MPMIMEFETPEPRTDGYDDFQLSDDGGQTWRAVTKAEYLHEQRAAGREKTDGSPYAAWSGGDMSGRMFPLTKPGVEVVNFAEIEVGPDRRPPAGGLIALTMSPDAGREFFSALMHAAARISQAAKKEANDEMGYADWLRWGASRLDAAIRAAVPVEAPEARP